MKLIHILSVFLVILVVLNLILMVLGRISLKVFWMVLILCGLIAYKGIPKLKK